MHQFSTKFHWRIVTFYVKKMSISIDTHQSTLLLTSCIAMRFNNKIEKNAGFLLGIERTGGY